MFQNLCLANVRFYKTHGLSTTKPGTLLKKNIPVRTFADWNEDEKDVHTATSSKRNSSACFKNASLDNFTASEIASLCNVAMPLLNDDFPNDSFGDHIQHV